MVARGFTLLELLIVLALIGLASAVVVPGLGRTYDAIVLSGERADVRRALGTLPLQARTRGEPMALTVEGGEPLNALVTLPTGWSVRLLDPLLIERSGICHRARVEVARDGQVEVWTLEPPACDVADAP